MLIYSYSLISTFLLDFQILDSINFTTILRRGYESSVLVCLYSLFIAVFAIGCFFVKQKKQFFLYLSLSFLLILSFKNLYSYYYITKTELQKYTIAKLEEKTLFDLGDYVTFTDKVRKILKLDDIKPFKPNTNCYYYSEGDFPYPYMMHWDQVYLKPCILTLNKSVVEYLIYYKKTPQNLDDYDLLLEWNGSYVLKNK